MSDSALSPTTSSARPPVSFQGGAWAVYRFTLPAIFWSKRTLFFGLLVMILPTIAAIFLMWKAIPVTEELRAGYVLYTYSFWLVNYFILLLALFFGTSVVAEEIEGKTLTYLFTRPVPKPAILLGKAAATWTTGALLLGPMLLLTYTLLTLGDGILAEYVLNAGIIKSELTYSGNPASFLTHLPTLIGDLMLTLAALAVYIAIFTFVGAFFNKPVLWGIALAFGWESWVAYVPGPTRKLTVMHYMQSLTSHASGRNIGVSVLGQNTPTGESIMALVVIFALFTFLALWTFSHREYIFDLSKR